MAHVTKSGELAGPKIVEHLVDCVLNFTGERDHDLRILRAYKNRFGTTSEIGAFQMEEGGLKEIRNLSGTFLESTETSAEGSVITAVYEGSRPVLFEIQALTAPANVGFARRTSVGVDYQRLNMILAVLEKKIGMTMINQDVYVNVVGGMRPDSTSVDLAVALAVYSSIRSVVCPKRDHRHWRGGADRRASLRAERGKDRHGGGAYGLRAGDPAEKERGPDRPEGRQAAPAASSE